MKEFAPAMTYRKPGVDKPTSNDGKCYERVRSLRKATHRDTEKPLTWDLSKSGAEKVRTDPYNSRVRETAQGLRTRKGQVVVRSATPESEARVAATLAAE